jgi:uncharacterized protein
MKSKDTELIFAAFKGDAKKVQVLLAAGADVGARGGFGETSLMLAEEGGHDEIVAVLKEQQDD